MNNTILLYKEDNFMIKYNKIDGTYFYYKNENKNINNYIKVIISKKRIYKQSVIKLAPLLKHMFERIYTIGHADGYRDREKTVGSDIIRALKIGFM